MLTLVTAEASCHGRRLEADGNGAILGNSSITWTRNIPPKESVDFFFKARNPATGTGIAWKAYQRFADGTTTGWVSRQAANARVR